MGKKEKIVQNYIKTNIMSKVKDQEHKNKNKNTIY
jgi:hypothetical protein